MTGERIILVEDSTDIRHFLAHSVLEPAGYEVLTAADGLEGLALARDLQPDLIISDYLMPGLNGLDLLRELNALQLRLPLILITAEGSEALAVQALRLGVSDYLIKPFDPDDLLAAVQRVLREHWTRQITDRVPSQLLDANRQLEQRLRELDTLVEVGKRITALLDLKAALSEVVEAAAALAQAEEGYVMLLDDLSGELYLYASTSADAQTDGSFRLPVTDSLVGQVIQTGQPLVLSGDELRKIKTFYLVHDLAVLPLRLHNRLIGVLGVANRMTSHAFQPHTIQLLSVLADFSAIAIENARLYARTWSERDTLNAILRDTEDAILVVDPGGSVVLCNRAACSAFGLSENGCIGQPLTRVISNRDLLDLFERGERPGRVRSGEIALDGGQRVLNAHLTVIEDVGRVVVMQDITPLKELDRLKSDFVTTVSHDLRSPLTTILGYVELLSRSGPLNEMQQEFTKRIIFSVRSITALITELLELGKIEAGLDQDREPTHLGLIVRYAVEGQRHQFESKKQLLTLDMPENVLPVLGNPLRLRQMVNNLLENAIKYTPAGGQIGVSLEVDSDFLVLRISDTGIGIPPQDQPFIFDKFYRTDQAIESYEGTGLGLSIVKGIVDAHGGRIWVDSQVGAGSTFTVMLPAYASSQ